MTCVAAACMLAAMPSLAQDNAAQDQLSGVSHPSSAPITTDTGDAASAAPAPLAKPSADVPSPAAAAPQTVYGPYVPYHAPGTPEQPVPSATAQTFDPDANIVTSTTVGQGERRPLNGANDEDAGIVTYVPSKPGEVREGTLVKVRLREELSTLTTKPGTKFTAEVSEPVMRNGQVAIPVGSVLEGRVTWVRGGKRIGGSAAIHLEPSAVILPDGTEYALRARVIDTSSWQNTKVDSEGTIMRGEDRGRNAGVMALTTGGGLAAGAMLGGPAGALIGAGVGAGVSTIVWLKQDRQADLPKDLGLVFSLTEPMDVTPASAAFAPLKGTSPGNESR